MGVLLEIRKKAKTEEIDYLFLMSCLSSYQNKRDKLSSFLKSNEIIRVKKGLYVFSKDLSIRPYSLEILANLIYGPSYVSFESALSFWGMIPEKVERVTSACFKRNKQFKTPVGEFVYHYIEPKKFPSGISWESVDENSHFLIATKEKALCDYLARQKPFHNQEDLFIYLSENMRILEDRISSLKLSLVEEIASLYQNKNVDLLCKILKKR